MKQILSVFNIVRTYSQPWVYWMIDRKLIGSRVKVKLNLRNGFSFWIRTKLGDHYIVNEVYLHKQYNEALERLTKQSIVIDVGAHIGCFSAAASRKARKVIAFEPVESNFQILSRNVDENGLSNIQPVNMGISNKKESLRIYLSKTNAGGHSSFTTASVDLESEIIHCVTLSSELSRLKINRVDLLKIDTEGMEYSILKSLTMNDQMKIRNIILEYHNWPQIPNGSQAILSYLISHQFQINYLMPLTAKTGIIYASKQ